MRSTKRNPEVDGYDSDKGGGYEDLSPCDKSTTDFGFYCCKALSKRYI